MRLHELVAALDRRFPPALAAAWDNTGLLLGDPDADIASAMTCLTVTPESAAEAIEQGVGLVVSHHPILFKAVQRVTAAGSQGYVYELARADVAVYSPHTRFDNAAGGINAMTADLLKLTGVTSLRPSEVEGLPGEGRCGTLPKATPLKRLAARIGKAVGSAHVRFVGEPQRPCGKVGVACGAAAESLGSALDAGCDALITGEARFHDCLRARASGVGMILVGHYASERFAVERLAESLGERFPELVCHASGAEDDPLVHL